MAKKKAKAATRTKRAAKPVRRAPKRAAKPRAAKRVVRAVKRMTAKIAGRKPSKFKRVAVVGKRFKDRFQKFYYSHRPDLNKFRRSLYSERKKKGVCVKCKKRSLASSIFCSYHLAKSRIYNGRRA